MRLIDADTVVTGMVYDDEHEECFIRHMTIADYLDAYTDEGCPPTIEAVPARGAFTINEAAEMLSSLFGDECACNFNNIDEWLPQRCKYCAAGECPNPSDKHGCWKQFLVHGYKMSEGGER